MAERKKLGDLLKEAGLIDDFQLQSALSHQRNWGGRLGAILVDMGFVKESDIAQVIAEKLRIPYVDLFDPPISDAIIRLIRPDIAKKYGVVPVKKDGGVLIVAMSDPMDIETFDAVRFATGLMIKPAMAAESEIRDAIRKYYDHEEVIHREKPSIREKLSSTPSEELEIIRESDMKLNPYAGMERRLTADQAGHKHEAVPDRLLLDSLINLLIEKDLISRDELVKMIEQKKIGL